MFKFLLLMVLGSVLVFLNPSLEQFETATRKLIEDEQSSIRSGWNSISRVTGLNAVAGAVGAGNFEVCRKNLYVASLFTITPSSLMGSTPVGVGAGAAGYFVIRKVAEDSSENSLIATVLASVTSQLKPTECQSAHKDGAF